MRKPHRGRRQTSASSSPPSSGAAGAAAATAAAKMMPKLPPGPMSLVEVFAWTLVSICAYLCFLILPGRLNSRKVHRKLNPLVAQDDLAYAGNHLHYGLWCWPIFDLIYRFLCLCLLPRWELIRMSFFATVRPRSSAAALQDVATSGEASPSTASEDSSVEAPSALPPQEETVHATSAYQIEYEKAAEKQKALLAYNKVYDQRLVSFFNPIRALVGSDGLISGAANKKDAQQQKLEVLQSARAGVLATDGEGSPSLARLNQDLDFVLHNHKFVVISTFLLMMMLLTLVVYRTHMRGVLSARRKIKEGKIRAPAPYPSNPSELPEVFSSEAKRREFEAQHSLFNEAESGLFPTVYAVCFWCITYATFFAWVRGMPLLMTQLYPVGVGCLVAYLIFLPG